MRHYLKTPYLLLLFLLVSCFLTYFFLPSKSAWLEDFSINLASEIIGIFIVVFSIDRVIAIEQAQERKKLEKVACLQLRRPILRHFYLIFNIFKSSTFQKPNKDYQNITDLFDETFFREVAFLDFSKPAPVITFTDATWSDYLTKECEQFQDSLNRTTEKYALFLPPDILDLMEELINDPFIWLVLQAQVIRQIGNRNNGAAQSYNFLARQEIRELLREYIQRFSQLLIYYNNNVPEEKRLRITHELWSNEVPPKIGSARIEMPVAEKPSASS